MTKVTDRQVPVGKRIRLQRLITQGSGACIVVALDHGMTSPKFLDGLRDTPSRITEAIDGGATALMLSRGSAAAYCNSFAGRIGFALMLTASAACNPGGPLIAPIGSVEEAGRLGADAVVVYVALNGADEREMIGYLSHVGEMCEASGMPLIAEAEFPNAYAERDNLDTRFGIDYLTRNARLCAEMGADIVKVNWSGHQASFASIIEACDRPVIVAGGPLLPDDVFLDRMVSARAAGAIGCSVGRNVFEHQNPRAMTRALARIFTESWTAADALEELKASPKAGTAGDGASRSQVRHPDGAHTTISGPRAEPTPVSGSVDRGR